MGGQKLQRELEPVGGVPHRAVVVVGVELEQPARRMGGDIDGILCGQQSVALAVDNQQWSGDLLVGAFQ
jgi:hypothetical protein